MFVYRAPPGSDAYSLVLSSGGPDANEVTTSTSVGKRRLGPGRMTRFGRHSRTHCPTRAPTLTDVPAVDEPSSERLLNLLRRAYESIVESQKNCGRVRHGGIERWPRQ